MRAFFVVTLGLTIAALAMAGCRIFSSALPCSSDFTCPPDERCVDGACALAIDGADDGQDAQDDERDDAQDDAPNDAQDAGPDGDGLADGADAGADDDDVEDAGVNVDDADAGADGADGADAGVDLGADEPEGGGVALELRVRLLWTDDVDLDLHVIQRDELDRYCRDPRRKPRDDGVVLGAGDLASECGPQPRSRDCGYSGCDERGTYDVDWLGDGPSLPQASPEEPVLVALDGVSGDVRSGAGTPAEQIDVRARAGGYLLSAAHPSPTSGDGSACARLKVFTAGAEVLCRAVSLAAFEWQDVAEIVIDDGGVVLIRPLAPADACTCP